MDPCPIVRLSRLLAPTLREDPADAEVMSHKLLVRAGMIRQVARGIYDFLPLGLRAVRRVEAIVREEMDRAGAQEILMPAVIPAELWKESGRWDHYGRELLRMQDRYDRDFCFGPTHEEVVTDLVRREIRSYRELPKTLYQIQVKFRDEVRPRFGLMRGREFIMKDAYSFHADRADAEREYRVMHETYTRIFERCGLRFRAVEAGTGAIGGSLSHEFQVLAQSGEDAIVACDRCGYAANVEKAEVGPVPAPQGRARPVERVATPGKRTVEEVAAFLGVPPERFVKTLIYQGGEGQAVAVLVRGDHEVSETKVAALLGGGPIELADDATVERVTGAPVGFAGPVGLRVRIVADASVRGLRDAVTGANQEDQHLVGVDQERDFPDVEFADLRQARAGDACARCGGGVYAGHRGIEVGQVFYLGTKYSAAMGAGFLGADGVERPLEMGCYGIGITRTVAAAIEQHHDDAGICWPAPLAPFGAHVVPVNANDATLAEAADRVAAELARAGIDVLLDDRDERPGVKFKDADLIGLPVRVTVGPRGLKAGKVEVKPRTATAAEEVPLAEAAARVAALVGPR
ncbi:MAG TPA: proline--tRNA ligase [Candidatus Limnocylindria bacterium]|nr:proline--tRNA ligase [Candidatus Limnocylindria bacterium]